MSLKLTLLSLLICTVLFSSAQDCIPDQSITSPGFHPRTIEDAAAGKSYKQVLQIRVFKDTVVVVAGNPTLATIDSINVDDIIDLPNGFYYLCSRPNCSFIPDSTGCATLNGNPTNADIGSHPFRIAITVYAKIFGSLASTQTDTLDQFTLNVTGNSGIADIQLNQNIAYPNPSNSNFFKINPLFRSQLENIACYNTIGEKIELKLGENSFELNQNLAGMYFVEYQFVNGKSAVERLRIVH